MSLNFKYHDVDGIIFKVFLYYLYALKSPQRFSLRKKYSLNKKPKRSLGCKRKGCELYKFPSTQKHPVFIIKACTTEFGA